MASVGRRPFFLLMADVSPELLTIDDLDMPATDSYRASAFEIRECAVDRNSGGADEAGEIFLSQINLVDA